MKPERDKQLPDCALTDTGNAHRFARQHKDRLRYDHDRGHWLHWDGIRWAIESGNEHANRLAMKTAESILTEAKGKPHDERGKIYRWAHTSESLRGLDAMLNLARNLEPIAAHTKDFDTDEFALNCQNGIVDLRTGELLPHDPARMMTKLCPVDYDPDAASARWDSFLRAVTRSDESLLSFLQAAIGYSITGVTREDKLFLIHGPAATGKSTFLEAIKAVLGDYAATADFETFLRRNPGGVRNDIARLAGARFVLSIEVERGRQLAEGIVKALTGGDTVTARHLYREHFEFRPQFKLWLACNDAPRVSDTDTGIWRRILRVPFVHTIPEAEQDRTLREALQNPEVRPAILAWLAKGCLRWQTEGLLVPDCIKHATQQYRNQQDPLQGFCEQVCEFGPDKRVEVPKLRTAYEQWTEDNGPALVLEHIEFNRRLEDKGCVRKPTKVPDESGKCQTVKCWHGVTIKPTIRSAGRQQPRNRSNQLPE